MMQTSVNEYFEHYNEPLNSIKGGLSLEQLSVRQLHRDFVSWKALLS
jgi:hypothetical protein